MNVYKSHICKVIHHHGHSQVLVHGGERPYKCETRGSLCSRGPSLLVYTNICKYTMMNDHIIVLFVIFDVVK